MSQTSVVLKSRDFPRLLKEIQDPPEQLYIHGSLPQNTPSLAIVGTRKASREGIRIAEEFAEYFAAMGIAIISGLAMGIDTAAHKGSLNQGGVTVAVLGTNLEVIYPAANTKLAEKIVRGGGALISEYFSSELPHKSNFLRRNRIISGLSSAVLIVEAPQRSGSLATARFAAEQGREVFVVPGPIRDVNYAGSHDLIRDGAVLVSSPEQLAEDMGWRELRRSLRSADLQEDLGIDEELIIDALKKEGMPLRVDNIIELAKLEPRVASVALTALVIKGLIVEDTAGYKLK
ncbi:MAG: DNA-processing protein DprA [Candidatus Colwellbacteria bacterium]|nr:DNA-processing protein DprA [Candidatus Colwellbacteria bacterium]